MLLIEGDAERCHYLSITIKSIASLDCKRETWLSRLKTTPNCMSVLCSIPNTEKSYTLILFKKSNTNANKL